MLKKILSVAVVLAMCLTLSTVMPFAEAADEAVELTGFEGDGTEEEPYLIEDADDLLLLAETVNGGNNCSELYFMMTDDIDLSNVCGENVDNMGEVSWTPIGSYTSKSVNSPFFGTFDGNGKKITGLYINASNSDYLGLFGYIDGGTLKNLSVNGCVNGHSRVGAVVGYNINGTIKNCSNTGTVSGSYFEAGGVVGYNEYGTVEHCHNTGMISGYSTYVSGVVGGNYYGTIENCYNTGTVIATAIATSAVATGGVVGFNFYGTVENCHNTGTVSGTYNVGGVVGGSYGTIKNCHNVGTVSGSTSGVGGVVGNIRLCTIENCFNTGKVSGGYVVGGVSGTADNATIRNCFNRGYVECTKPYNSVSVKIGGISGSIDSFATIENCFNIGDVFCVGAHVGGVAGHIYRASTIKNSYNTGNITGTEYVGGVIGQIGDRDDTRNSMVLNSYNIGKTSGDSNVGGVVGYQNSACTSQSSYYLEGQADDAIGVNEGSDNSTNVYSITEEAFKIEDTFNNWNFNDIWFMSELLGRPILRFFPEQQSPVVTPPQAIDGLVYDSRELELITPGDANGLGVMVYSLSENEGYSTDIPVGTNADKYTVWYKVIDEEGNDVIEPQSLTVEIAKAIPKPTVPERTALYGQTLKDVDPLPEGFSWNDDSTTSVGGAGTNYFSATYTPSNSNFCILYDVPVPVTVVYFIPPKAVEGLEHRPTLPQALVEPGKVVIGTMVYKVEKAEEGEENGEEDDEKDEDEGSEDDDEKDEDEGSEDDDEKGEDEGSEDDDKKDNDDAEGGSGQTETRVLITDGNEDRQIDLFDLLSDDGYSEEIPTGIDAGTYEVYYKVIGDDIYNDINYDDIAPQPLTVYIAKADPVPPNTDLNATVGQKLKDVKLPMGFAWVDDTQSVGNVGTNYFPAIFTPADTKNFNTLEIELPVKVTNPNVPTETTTTTTTARPPVVSTTTTTTAPEAAAVTTTAAPETSTAAVETTTIAATATTTTTITTAAAPEVTTEPPSTASPPPSVTGTEDEDKSPHTGIVLVIAPLVAASISVVVSKKRK